MVYVCSPDPVKTFPIPLTTLIVGKKVVVAGCVSQGAPNTKFIEGLSVVGVQQIDRVVEVVEETFKGNYKGVAGSYWLTGCHISEPIRGLVSYY